MEIEKFTDKQVNGLLAHMNRMETSSDNLDIDSGRTSLNYSLTPYTSVSRTEYQTSRKARGEVKARELEYYRQRKSEVYCYPRADVNTLVGAVITAPRELAGSPEKQEAFFRGVADFLFDRYGGEPTADGRMHPNIVSAEVHYDERQTADALIGHMHVSWVPAVKIDKVALMEKPKHVKAMENFDYKMGAKEMMNKSDLKSLHGDLQHYLDSHGIEGKVLLRGEGEGRRINLTIEQIKDYTDRTGKTIDPEILRNMTVDRVVSALEHERSIEQSRWTADKGHSHDNDRGRW